MRILVARHAEDKGEPHDPIERPLTESGRAQAHELAKIIVEFKPTKIFSSTLERSRETAAIIAEKLNIGYSALEFLQEQMLGDDRSYEVEKLIENQGYVDLDEQFDRGESYSDLVKRCEEIKSWLLNEFKSDDRIVFILHGKIMTFLLAIILDYTPNGFFLEVDNTSYYVVDIPQYWRPQLVLPQPNQLYI